MKIRLTTFTRDDEDLKNKMINRYCGGSPNWKNLTFVSDESYDRLVIFTCPHYKTQGYDASKAITLMTEPPGAYHRRPHATSRIDDMYLLLPFLPSQIYGSKKYYGNGEKVSKDRLLSIVCSDLYELPGHKARLEFINHIDKIIEEGLDIFGRSTGLFFSENINNYRGELENKFAALWSYKYHFACENSFEPNYFTEKIADPIIAECLCFYHGCENIEDFIDERAFIRINVFDIESTINVIVEAIQNNEWAIRIKYIREQKRRLLSDLHPLNIIWMAVHDQDVLNACKLR